MVKANHLLDFTVTSSQAMMQNTTWRKLVIVIILSYHGQTMTKNQLWTGVNQPISKRAVQIWQSHDQSHCMTNTITKNLPNLYLQQYYRSLVYLWPPPWLCRQYDQSYNLFGIHMTNTRPAAIYNQQHGHLDNIMTNHITNLSCIWPTQDQLLFLLPTPWPVRPYDQSYNQFVIPMTNTRPI